MFLTNPVSKSFVTNFFKGQQERFYFLIYKLYIYVFCKNFILIRDGIRGKPQ